MQRNAVLMTDVLPETTQHNAMHAACAPKRRIDANLTMPLKWSECLPTKQPNEPVA